MTSPRSGVIIPTRFGPHELTVRDVERFWSKVDRSGGPDACHLWTGSLHPSGSSLWYGTFRVRLPEERIQVHVGAHRLALILAHVSIPEGELVRHRCPEEPNTLCMNVRHLATGSHADNTEDMVGAGRQTLGQRNSHSKLTEDDVREVRWLHSKAGMSLKDLGILYGVTPQNIGDIVRYHIWAWLPDEEKAVAS